MPKHEVIVSADVDGVDEGLRALLRSVIRTTLDEEGVDVPCEVSLLITNDTGIRRVNIDMRHVDAPTDVLSFPMFELSPGDKPSGDDADPGSGLVPLGDICISLDRAVDQAREYGHSDRRELAYLTVHSTLHLLGYDHLDDGPMKAEMRRREEAVMAKLGLER